MLPFWIALQFLSSLPVRLPGMPEPRQVGRSLLCYPLVGLLFGLLLWLASDLLHGAPTALHAALLLTLWVLLSGALHLDGLAADSGKAQESIMANVPLMLFLTFTLTKWSGAALLEAGMIRFKPIVLTAAAAMRPALNEMPLPVARTWTGNSSGRNNGNQPKYATPQNPSRNTAQSNHGSLGCMRPKSVELTAKVARLIRK